ncbi:MAG: DNA-binding protein, partial [Roseococcus sp.]
MPRDASMQPREWFSAAELAALALPGMPATKRGVTDLAERQDWQRAAWEGTHWRLRTGRGGGVEYHLAVLPMVARAKLAFAEHQAAAATQPLVYANPGGALTYGGGAMSSTRAQTAMGGVSNVNINKN